MIVYAESSAVLSWLFGEPSGDTVREYLAAAEWVLTSELTLLECERACIRALTLDLISPSHFTSLRTRLHRSAAYWVLLILAEVVLERARRPFPHEPIRTLDALHVASALETASQIPDIHLLSMDQRIRTCGRALGLEVIPSDPL